MMRVALLPLFLALFLASGIPAPANLWDDVAASLRQGDHRQAITLLESAAQDSPGSADIHRILGVCRMEAGDYAGAEASLLEAIRLQPSSSAARLSLARVLALRGAIDEAAERLREVLALAPESSYAAKARDILPGLEQLKETLLVQEVPRRWDLYLRIAGEYDDNVPARSRHNPASDTDSARAVASARAAYRLADQRIHPRLPTLEGGYSIYRSWHDDSAFRSYDVTSQSASVELSRYGELLGRWVKLSVAGVYTHTELGGEAFSESAGVDSALTLQPAPALLAVAAHSAHWKEFEDDTEFPGFFSRDGLEQEARLEAYAYLLKNRLILGLAYAYLWNDVDGSQFELDRHSVRASATAALPAKLRLYASATYATEDYDRFTPDPRREDDRLTAYASLSRPLWNPDWRAELNATYSTSDSSQEFAEYERAVYGLALSWSP